MRKILPIAVMLLMAASMLAQESPALLSRSGNMYFYGNEILQKNQMEQWYAEHNCPVAQVEFKKASRMATAGWACLGIGLGLDISSIACCIAYAFGNTRSRHYRGTSDPLFGAAIGLTCGAAALEIASIPLLAVGYSRMHRTVDIYNITCSTAYVPTYWTIQASSNGLGLAWNF